MRVRNSGVGLGGLGSIELELLADVDDVEIVAGADVSPDSPRRPHE